MLDHPEVRDGLHLGDRRAQDVVWAEMVMFAGQWSLFGTGNWVLEHRDSGAFVGRAGLHDPVREAWPGLEVGWTLAREFWGQGYATEAGRAAITYAFETLGRNEVYSTILPTNTGSQAVARRLGFTWLEDRPLPILKNNPIGIWHLAAR